MSHLSVSEVIERLHRLADNSSHFVWLKAGLRYTETREGFVFAWRREREVVVIALEPLFPVGSEAQLESAWAEFRSEVPARTYAWVGIQSAFFLRLRSLGVQGIEIGREPWIDLRESIPRGNRGKGVRAARNQAKRAGIRVREIPIEGIVTRSPLRAELEGIHQFWRESRWVSFGGFLNEASPFSAIEGRRLFVAEQFESGDCKVQGYLTACSVALRDSWFIEDIALARGAAPGTGELLMTEAMETLNRDGAKEASLGVVSSPSEVRAPDGSGAALQFFFFLVRKLGSVYKSQGIELFRKRFKPSHWDPVHFAVAGADGRRAGALDWSRAILAVASAFEPKLQLSPTWAARALSTWLKRYGFTTCVAMFTISLFFGVNHGGVIPEQALARFAFTGKAPFHEWWYRSILSDFLYPDAASAALGIGALCFVLGWAERSFKRAFTVPLFVISCIVDDLVNYALLYKPFHLIRPQLFELLVSHQDIGSSLLLSTFAGASLFHVKKMREPLGIIAMFGIVLVTAFTSLHFHWFILRLNHALFFGVGYAAGAYRLELIRRASRRVCRGDLSQSSSGVSGFWRRKRGVLPT